VVVVSVEEIVVADVSVLSTVVVVDIVVDVDVLGYSCRRRFGACYRFGFRHCHTCRRLG